MLNGFLNDRRELSCFNIDFYGIWLRTVLVVGCWAFVWFHDIWSSTSPIKSQLNLTKSFWEICGSSSDFPENLPISIWTSLSLPRRNILIVSTIEFLVDLSMLKNFPERTLSLCNVNPVWYMRTESVEIQPCCWLCRNVRSKRHSTCHQTFVEKGRVPCVTWERLPEQQLSR